LEGGELSFYGRAVIRVPPRGRIVRLPVTVLGRLAAQYIAEAGGKVASEISDNPNLVLERLGPEAYRLYEEYQNEEHAIRAGSGTHSLPLSHFVATTDAKHNYDVVTVLRGRLAALLADRVSTDRCSVSMKDLEMSLQLFGANPDLALLNDYHIVERVARAAYEALMGKESRKTPPFTQLLKALAEAPSPVPDDVVEIMKIMARLGKTSQTSPPRRKPTLNDGTMFFMSFVATIRIADWFVRNWDFGKEFAH